MPKCEIFNEVFDRKAAEGIFIEETFLLSYDNIKATPHRDCGADAQSDFTADCAIKWFDENHEYDF